MARNPGFSTDDTITVEKARELGSGKSKESSSQKLNGLENKIIIAYAK